MLEQVLSGGLGHFDMGNCNALLVARPHELRYRPQYLAAFFIPTTVATIGTPLSSPVIPRGPTGNRASEQTTVRGAIVQGKKQRLTLQRKPPVPKST